IPEPYVWD
nr:osmoregulator factor [Erpobdella octoculata]